jgi:hypothetical protein
MAYMGPPVLVADVVLWPDRSILKQSYDARERKMDASLPQHLVGISNPLFSRQPVAQHLIHAVGVGILLFTGIWQLEWGWIWNWVV